jgi:poly(3-hydroxyalkanoate) synthetase
MNGNEIRWIVENLFIGNKLTRGEAFLSDGTQVDLTRIEAPIVVFASYGDNITPPR